MTEKSLTDQAGTPRASVRGRLFVSAVAALLSLVIARFVFLDVHVTSDEDAYIFQAYTFLEGRLRRPLPPIPRVFDHEMLIQCKDTGWTSRYAPGHSLWLMAGAALDNPKLMVAVAAGLTVWLMAGCAVLLGAPWWTAAVLLLISPYFLFIHGTVLSHTSAITAVAAMLWSYLLWTRERRIPYAAIAGLAWAFLFINRTYTASLLAMPIGIHALCDIAGNYRERRIWKGVLVFAGTALAGPMLFMLYNRLVTGDAFMSTYVYYHPKQRMGFSDWSKHTPALGLEHLRNNLRRLDLWLLGFRGGLPFFIVLAILGWNKRWSLLAVTSIMMVIFGHILFWYEGVNTCGPFYYLEALPYFVLLWILACRRLGSLVRKRRGKALAAVLGAVLAGNALAFMMREGRAIAAEQEPYAGIHAVINSAPPHSIVAVAGLDREFLYGQLSNPRGINGDILAVQSIGEYDLISARYFHDRRFFLLNGTDSPRLEPVSFDKSLFTYDVDLSKTSMQVGRMRLDENELPAARYCMPEMGAGFMSFGPYPFLPSGHFCVVFKMKMDEVARDSPVRIEVVAESGKLMIAERLLHGGGPDEEYVLEFENDDFRSIEPRVWYGGSGRVEYRGARIRELPNGVIFQD